MQPSGYHIAEFNIGTLRYDWEDPRVKDFADNLDRVYAVAMRAPGFVWRMSDDAMEDAQCDPKGPLGGNPRTASTLSVWEDITSLENFVWNTVHKQFYDRKHEWYAPSDALRLVLWWVPAGHRPTIAEAGERYRHLEEHGETEFSFGWAGAKEAALWKAAQCEQVG